MNEEEAEEGSLACFIFPLLLWKGAKDGESQPIQMSRTSGGVAAHRTRKPEAPFNYVVVLNGRCSRRRRHCLEESSWSGWGWFAYLIPPQKVSFAAIFQSSPPLHRCTATSRTVWQQRCKNKRKNRRRRLLFLAQASSGTTTATPLRSCSCFIYSIRSGKWMKFILIIPCTVLSRLTTLCPRQCGWPLVYFERLEYHWMDGPWNNFHS